MIALEQLDVNVVTHCNQRCVSCSHASPFTKPWTMSGAMLSADLLKLREFARFDRIHLVGGEPTLHPQLAYLIEIVKASKIAKEIWLITNGRTARNLPPEFWESPLDAFKVSVYGTMKQSQLDWIHAECKKHGKRYEQQEFPTFHRQLRSAPNDGAHFLTCFWRHTWTVHKKHFARCPQSLFYPQRFMGLDEFADSLALDGLTDETFAAFVNQTEPPNACRICMANERNEAPWREAKTREEWTAGSTL